MHEFLYLNPNCFDEYKTFLVTKLFFYILIIDFARWDGKEWYL